MQQFKNIFHLLEALVASIYFGHPTNKIKVIGVTGTDGKTTTSHLIYHILQSCGHSVSLVSSIHAIIGGKVIDTGFHTTTPRAWNVQKLLKKAADTGSEYFILETTSHALSQNRVWGIEYEVSVLTNISHEHILYHKTFEEYMKSKLLLLLRSKSALLNRDHEDSYKPVSKVLNTHNKLFKTFSVHDKTTNYFWSEKKEIPLEGVFNHQNAMAAYSVCREIGISHEQIVQAISSFKLPMGRFDVIRTKPFTIIVDFAHTPAAIQQILETTAKKFQKIGSRIIHVFGAASERDDAKRPLMGEASGQFSTIAVLTEEDYRHENVHMICESIALGLQRKGFEYRTPQSVTQKTNKKSYVIIPNRQKAIQFAISVARKGDIIIATGKSHEKSLNRGGTEYVWSEYNAFNEALKDYDNTS